MEEIRRRREELGLSQEELGAKVGVSGVTVSRWERGADAPAAWRLPTLADALDVSIDRLFGRKTAAQNQTGGTV